MFSIVGAMGVPCSLMRFRAKVVLLSAQATESWVIAPGVVDTLVLASSFAPTSGWDTSGAYLAFP